MSAYPSLVLLLDSSTPNPLAMIAPLSPKLGEGANIDQLGAEGESPFRIDATCALPLRWLSVEMAIFAS